MGKTVIRKLSFIADWYIGNNRFGYPFIKRQFLYVGYNFGNTGRADNYFSALYGIAC